MKKDLIKIVLLALILSIISFVVVLVFGKTYTIDLNLPNIEELNIKLESKTGEVEILDERKDEGHYYIIRCQLYIFLDVP